MQSRLLYLALAAPLLAALPSARPRALRDATLPIVVPNPNMRPAGTLRGDTLAVRMVAREGSWAPDEQDSPALAMSAFAEEHHSPSNPGPLIRVTQGTQVHVTLRNALARPIYLHGLYARPVAAEPAPVRIEAGETRDFRFDPGAPGTYFYWAADSASETLGERLGTDSQLNGVIAVDARGEAVRDRIFVITTFYFPPDSSRRPVYPERFGVVANGRSWPHTERFTYTQGDSVRWRWVNASVEGHPMHLHGFFFRITRSGNELADTLLPADRSRLGVTEEIVEGQTREILWVPEQPGNWVLHCHIQAHVSPMVLRMEGLPEPHGAGGHAMHAMMGLATGVQVMPRGHATISRPAQRRAIRLAIERQEQRRSTVAVGITDTAGSLAGGPTSPGVPIILHVGEPVRITIVNRMHDPTSIHWHGLELESYFDGVAGWSGSGQHVAPLIAPGDSFAVDITPVRAGTYIYHTHVEETHQRGDGGYGPLIVLDSGEHWDPDKNRIFLLGGREIEDTLPPMLNGSPTPPPMELVAGTTYRLRLISIMENNAPFMRVMRGDSLARWQALARDAAPLPSGLAVMQPAQTKTATGSTFDYAFTPAAGDYTFEVRRGSGKVVNRQVIRARPAGRAGSR